METSIVDPLDEIRLNQLKEIGHTPESAKAALLKIYKKYGATKSFLKILEKQPAEDLRVEAMALLGGYSEEFTKRALAFLEENPLSVPGNYSKFYMFIDY